MLNEKLDLYLEENYYPFHMPGSKRTNILRNDLPYKRDLTEIDGFDNLNDPKDIFVSMQSKLADIYKVKKSIISTNGSTSGLLSVIRALTYDNKNILIERSSHKAVYNACELNKIDVSYIDIITNEISAIVDIDYDDFEKKISSKDYSCVVITSPSYEGYILDLDKIYKLCQKYSTKLVLDMAHGSHLPLTDSYRTSFDVAITSFHKNLSALTPSAAVLVNDLEIYNEIERNMAIFQTSSPSYVILQSIDEMIEKFPTFNKMYDNLKNNLLYLYSQDFKNIQVIDNDFKDKSKILISTNNTNLSGSELASMLKKEKIEIEMAYPNYVLLISTIFDRNEGFDRLIEALYKIDKDITRLENKSSFTFKIPRKSMEIYECIHRNKKNYKLYDSIGKICGDFIYAYPPGIPILVPGELIDEDIIKNIKFLLANNINMNITDENISCIN